MKTLVIGGRFRCWSTCDKCGLVDPRTFNSTAGAIDAVIASGWHWEPSGQGRLTCPDCSAVERTEPVLAGISGEANKKGEHARG